jgi:hypothetical protein
MHITIDSPDELLALVRQFVRADQAGPRPHRPEPDQYDEDEAAGVQRDPPPPRRQGGSGDRNDAPRTGRQFAGWIFKQPKALSERAKEIAKSNELPTRWTDLSDDDARWLHHELTARGPAPADSNGRWGGRNGQPR